MYNEHYYECENQESDQCTCSELIEVAESQAYDIREAEMTGN